MTRTDGDWTGPLTPDEVREKFEASWHDARLSVLRTAADIGATPKQLANVGHQVDQARRVQRARLETSLLSLEVMH